MENIQTTAQDGIATVVIHRGKVNAINEAVVDELQQTFDDLKAQADIRAVVLTGAGKFFSFGFDVPELYDYTPKEFTYFLDKFTELYTSLFIFPKPVIAAINGHAIAGGCMLALACDHRIMAEGGGKISLNEITFGSSVFAGSVEMLRYSAGSRNAQAILYGGEMFGAEQAAGLGLVDSVVPVDELTARAAEQAGKLAARNLRAFASIKLMLKMPVADSMRRLEPDSIDEFVRIWYSKETRESLKSVRIR